MSPINMPSFAAEGNEGDCAYCGRPIVVGQSCRPSLSDPSKHYHARCFMRAIQGLTPEDSGEGGE